MSMNYITLYDIDCFQIVINSSIFISHTNDLQKEIDTNMWVISIPADKKKDFSLLPLKQSIKNLIKNRKQQLKDANISHSVVFYMWFDEMASQLRFNVVSYHDKKLPFGCRLNIVESIEDILEKYLNDKGYLSFDDFTCFDKDDSSSSDDDNEDEYVLDVFMQELNVSFDK